MSLIGTSLQNQGPDFMSGFEGIADMTEGGLGSD